MNGNFRLPEYIKRYEYNYYDLIRNINPNIAAGARQTRNDYFNFEIDNTGSINPLDFYNGYIEMHFKILPLTQDQGGAGIATGTAKANSSTVCNAYTFIKEIKVECDGRSIFSNDRANETSNVLQFLNYSKEYANSIAKDQFYYIDTSTGEAKPQEVTIDDTNHDHVSGRTANYNEGYAKRLKLTGGGALNQVSIPLNIYSYFTTFKRHLHPNIKTKISIKLEDDNNIIFRQPSGGNGAPDSKVLVTKLRLWIPLITFHGNFMQSLLEKYLSPQKWIFLKEYTETQTTTATNSYFRTSTALRRPRHI